MIRSNSGFMNIDRRFGTIVQDVTCRLSREQHYLERLNDRLSPELIPSPTAWFDAAENITLNGSNVSVWGDKSGNGLDLTQSTTSAQPPYNSSNPNVNNLPTVDCNNDDSMETADSSLLDLTSTGGFTAYLVGSLDSWVSTFSFLIGRTNSTSWTLGWGVFYYSGALRWFVNDWNTAAQRCETSGPSAGSVNIFKMRYDQTNITAEIIGPSADSDTQPYTSAVQEPSSEGLLINAGGSTAYDADFDYAEYIFYNRPLETNEQTKVENYLKSKYNIS